MRLDLSLLFFRAMSKGSVAKESPTAAKKDVSLSKAAFLMVTQSLGRDLEDREQLMLALQHAGYNPNKEFMDRYWTSAGDATVNFEQFDRILQTEPMPRKLDLVSYFRKLDPTGAGSIDPETLVSALATRGDHKMNPESVRSILSQYAKDEDGGFDYVKYVHEVFETSAELAMASKERVAADIDQFALNSKTYKVKRKTPSPSKSPVKRWKSLSKLKGAFYFEGDVIISHQYTFKVNKGGNFDVAVEALESSNSVDCQLYLFRLMGNDAKGSPDSKVQLVARSPLLLAKNYISSESLVQNKSWSGHLSAGSYLIIPSTTGCRMKKRKSQPDSNVSLVSGKGEEMRLTNQFSQTLSEIFDQVDLDNNGSLSRTEFNLFNWRTSGEEVQDEEWDVVRENFSLRDNELTLQGFLQLHQMEAEDNGGDSAELWITLNAMGYNASLQQDEASVFEVTVRSEEEDRDEVQLEVSGLKSGGALLDKATIRCIMQECKKPKMVDRAKDVLIYREDTSSCASFVIENRSSDSVRLMMDFGQSSNVLINHPHLAFQTGLSPKSTLFVAHLVPEDALAEHSVNLQVSLLNM